MLKNTLFVLAILTAAATAHAQGDTGGTPETPPPAAPTTPAPVEAMPTTGGAGPFQKGTLGFSLPVVLVSNVGGAVASAALAVPTIDGLYFLNNKAAIDVIFGLQLFHGANNATPPMTATTFGIAVGAGYRAYLKDAGRVHLYAEPSLVISAPDTSNSATLGVGINGAVGIECFAADWLSFAGTGGLGIQEVNGFKQYNFATTASLLANLYWK